MNASSIRRAYAALFDAWYGMTIEPTRGSVQSCLSVTELAPGLFRAQVEKHNPLELNGFPVGNMQGVVNLKRQLGANLAFRQDIRDDNETGRIEASTIYLTYWKRWPGGEYHWMDKWRFDMAPGDTGGTHPTYHAQLCQEDGAAGPVQSRISRGPAHLSQPRVPTAPLSVPSVLEMLLTDHFTSVLRKKPLVDSWMPIVANMPRLGPSPCQPGKTNHLTCGSRCWYAGSMLNA